MACILSSPEILIPYAHYVPVIINEGKITHTGVIPDFKKIMIDSADYTEK